MQRIANLVDLEKPCKMTIWLLSWLSIQPRTSPLKFDHFVVKSEKGSISNLSTKVAAMLQDSELAVRVAACRALSDVEPAPELEEELPPW